MKPFMYIETSFVLLSRLKIRTKWLFWLGLIFFCVKMLSMPFFVLFRKFSFKNPKYLHEAQKQCQILGETANKGFLHCTDSDLEEYQVTLCKMFKIRILSRLNLLNLGYFASGTRRKWNRHRLTLKFQHSTFSGPREIETKVRRELCGKIQAAALDRGGGRHGEESCGNGEKFPWGSF